MEESQNEKRPARKLTVRNFSVIKHAELEFGKITVLIGPQAHGKSLLCKLAYFLGGEIVATAVESLINKNSWQEFLQTIVRDFHSRFSTNGWLKTSFRASFSSQQYTVGLRGVGDPLSPGIQFSFSEEFQELYASISNNPAKQPSYANMSRSELRQDLWIELSLLQNRERTQANTFIPSGRAFFTVTGKSVAVLQNPDLDWITRRFAGQITWDTRWKAGLLTTGRGVVQEIEKELYRIAGGLVAIVEDKPLFLSWDGRHLPLPLLSSGTQELLPMFSMMNYLAFHSEHFYARSNSTRIPPLAEISEYSPLIYLEEPEAHVFPGTQHELVKLFAWLARDPVLSFDWIITTHSPYVLSAFNNLIYAGQLGRDETISRKIPIEEKYWIEPGAFAAYSIHDGLREPILSKSGLIDGEYLDSVSESIGREFDSLLRLEYDKTKAS
jgi:hypothetical protein